MLLRYIGSDTLASVETGFGGESISVSPWDIIQVHPDTNLEEQHPSLFTRFTQFGQSLQKKVTISSAEILALNSTPKELIAAPWAGYIVDVRSITAFLDYNGAAYATYTTLDFRYTNWSGAKVVPSIANLLDQTANRIVTSKWGLAPFVSDITNIRTPLGWLLTGSTTWDAGSIDDGNEEVTEITVTGAALWDFVLVSSSLDVADLGLVGQVTATNTVTVQLLNNTGGAIDLAEATVYVAVIPRSNFTAPAAQSSDDGLINVANAAVVAYAPSGDPVTGDSPVYVTIDYTIIQV